MTVKEFSRFARITRETLRHYENIGLLLPMAHDSNKYRQYSHLQLATVNLIRTCQALGMPLSEIKALISQRSPDGMVDLLAGKIGCIDDVINNWCRSRKLLNILMTTIHSVHGIDESSITVQYYPEQAITIGEPNDYSGGKDPYDALVEFYQSCMERYPYMDLNYSVWGLFSEERIKRHDWVNPDCFYFNNPDGEDKKAAADYVVGYTRGGYGQCSELYERILEYTSANGLQIYGPAYEEYPLNEISIADNSNYLIRVMIAVNKI